MRVCVCANLNTKLQLLQKIFLLLQMRVNMLVNMRVNA